MALRRNIFCSKALLFRLPIPKSTLCNSALVHQFSSDSPEISSAKPSEYLPPFKALNILRAETDPKAVLQVFRQSMEQPGFQHLRSAYEVTVKKLALAHQYDDIQEILEQLMKVSKTCTEGLIIRIIMLYGMVGMPQHAIQTFNEMKKLNCVRTVKSFNALLNALVEAQTPKLVHGLYKDRASFGITADLQTCNTVVKALCEMKQPESALLFLDEMSKDGCEPDIVTYNTILWGFYNKEKYKEADELLVEMSKTCPPDVATYNIRIGKLCRDRRTNEARKLIDEMVSKGLKPDIYSFNKLITGFCKENNLREAKRIFYDMSGMGCDPNNLTFFTMIYFLSKEGDFDLAFELCTESMSKNWIPNMETADMLIDGLVKSSKVKDARKVISGMKKRFPDSYLSMWDSI